MDAYQGYKLKQTFISTPYSKSEVELTVTNDGYSKVIEYDPRYCFKPVCTTGYNLVVYNEVIRTSYILSWYMSVFCLNMNLFILLLKSEVMWIMQM